MTEQVGSTLIEKAGQGKRIFGISAKSHVSSSSTPEGYSYGQITEDMAKNAEELEPGVDWEFVWRQVTAVAYGRRRVYGREAIARGYTGTMLSILKGMSWEMDSPEVVYMSGYLPLWSLGKEIKNSEDDIQKITNGGISFTGGVSTEDKIKTSQGKIDKLVTSKTRIGESLDEYARQFLSDNPLYLSILQSILFLGHIKGVQNADIFKKLKEGDLEWVAKKLHIPEENTTNSTQ